MTYLIIIIIGLNFFSNFISKKNPSAYYFNRYVEDAGFYPINSSSIFNFIQIIDSKSSIADPIDFDSIRIIGAQQIIDSYLQDQNLSKYNHWIYDYCNNDSYIKGIEDITSNVYFKNSACIRKYFNKEKQKYYNTNEKGLYGLQLKKVLHILIEFFMELLLKNVEMTL